MSPRPLPRRLTNRQRGTTLVEALITFLVLSIGLLGVSRVQAQLRLAGETARQRSEAVRLAEEDIEQLRAFSGIAAPGGATGGSYADIVPTQRTFDTASGYAGNTAYRLQRRVVTSPLTSARDVSIVVGWSDRAGVPQQVRLESVIAASDPALSGALGVAPAAATANGPAGRAVGVPFTARDLGNGRSAFGPLDGAPAAFIVDNASGLVVERCQTAGGSAALRSAAALSGCVRVTAYLLSGVVRFATGASADIIGAVLPATIALRTIGGPYPAAPECSSAAVVAADGDRYLQYTCIVYPLADGRWSGDTYLVPTGWNFGTGRYRLQACTEGAVGGSSDVGGARGGDRLAHDLDVRRTLTNRNFRIVRGDLACPPP